MVATKADQHLRLRHDAYPQTDPYPTLGQNSIFTVRILLQSRHQRGDYRRDLCQPPAAALAARLRCSGGRAAKAKSSRVRAERWEFCPSAAAYLASDVVKMSGQRSVTTSSGDGLLERSGNPGRPDVRRYGEQGPCTWESLVNQCPGTAWTNAVDSECRQYGLEQRINPLTHNHTTTTSTCRRKRRTPGSPVTARYIGRPQPRRRESALSGFVPVFSQFDLHPRRRTHYYYEHSLDELRGTWGIDTSTDTAWAVLDVGNGIFAVVPEPASIRLLAGGMLSLAIAFWWRRRTRIRAAKAAKFPGTGGSR